MAYRVLIAQFMHETNTFSKLPTTLDDYRAIYRAYLHDPDLQDARARFAFVNMWDNHEFSWRGYQGIEKFGKDTVWGQTRKVAAPSSRRRQISSISSCAIALARVSAAGSCVTATDGPV